VPAHGATAKLGAWANQQRHEERCGQLSPAHRQRLAAAGFTWLGLDAKQEAAWQRRFEQLCAFQRQHGHTHVQPDNSPQGLYHWVHVQRYLHKNHKLAPECERQLMELGFVWSAPAFNAEQRWEDYFNQLQEFQRVHGHFQVPAHGATEKLGVWANQQRHAQRCGQLSPAHRQRLAAAGFTWLRLISRYEAAWNRSFDQLLEFHRQHGHFRVPGDKKSYQSLYAWLWRQKTADGAGRLRADRRQRLLAAGVLLSQSGFTRYPESLPAASGHN
jgi:hypothetical protein